MNTHRLIRKTHRYLGVFIGIQFLGWTISGLYFSWNNIDDVHGDHLRKNPRFISIDTPLASPEKCIEQLRSSTPVDSIHSIQLISLAGKPLYQIAYFSGHTGDVHYHTHYRLADATTGLLRDALGKEEAVLLAQDYVRGPATVIDAALLLHTNGHHEYRERPLPAWRVTFSDPSCTVYISAERGTFQTIRHDQWRNFDFLWMFHTMDYESRDDINNWLLKIFSILGFVTILSGFILFLVSSKTLRKLIR
jgi:hypothetical protein